MTAKTFQDVVVESPAISHVGLWSTVRSEWIKLISVRSTWWTLGAATVLGIGLTALICGLNADWLASGEADEAPGSFVMWGMMFAQICAIVIGVLAVTTEYGTGLIRSTLAATPHRGRVLVAKMIVVASTLFVFGIATSYLGYLSGNYFLDREGIGVAFDGDVMRAVLGNGLFMAGMGLFGGAAGFVIRHTAAAISIVLAGILIIPNMLLLIPGDVGEWIAKMSPGAAGSVIATPVSFDPTALGPWTGFGVFTAETAALMAVAWLLLRRRDA
ncbi:ABC transporter permease [Aeromicrobium sp. A1-2]|uniref:ABC transporter permease n=1 Tax=Aeromicrobium sp. A1-2 TaxID=2107713 RepID=UPI000E5425A8|nr:ABC transporter permease [Aeromicrobium sp. A1-2]AXT86627.1 ABC transporter permease [Aeromicrobium sp. A1-2]